MWIAIVGDFDTEQALADVRRAFGGLAPVDPIPRNPTREPEQHGERRQIVHIDVRSPILAGAWHAPGLRAPGRRGARRREPDPVGRPLEPALPAPGATRRRRRSAAEGAYWELADAGLFYAFASVRPDAKIEDVERLFLAEIARLRDAARERSASSRRRSASSRSRS